MIQYGPFTIKCIGLPTMIDGKMRMHWSGTTHGTNCCIICDAGPLERSKRNGNFTPIESRYQYGFTCLHLRPRTMEWCAKFYINQDVKSYQVTAPFKHLAKQRKKEFIAKCWDRLRVRVYKVLPGRQGNTNTGENARKLFRNHEVFADICEAEHFLIKGLKILLDAYNCSLPIDADKLEEFAEKWLDAFFQCEKAWNILSPTVHFLTEHAPDIVRVFPCPPGQSTEENGEKLHRIQR